MRISPRRFLAEDFRDQTWISKLLGPLNDFLNQVVQLTSGNTTIQDNLRAEIKSIDVIDTNLPLKFRCKFPEKPLTVFVGQVEEVSASPQILTQPVWAHWTWVDGVVTVHHISGLTTGSRYRINLQIHYL